MSNLAFNAGPVDPDDLRTFIEAAPALARVLVGLAAIVATGGNAQSSDWAHESDPIFAGQSKRAARALARRQPSYQAIGKGGFRVRRDELEAHLASTTRVKRPAPREKVAPKTEVTASELLGAVGLRLAGGRR